MNELFHIDVYNSSGTRQAILTDVHWLDYQIAVNKSGHISFEADADAEALATIDPGIKLRLRAVEAVAVNPVSVPVNPACRGPGVLMQHIAIPACWQQWVVHAVVSHPQLARVVINAAHDGSPLAL